MYFLPYPQLGVGFQKSTGDWDFKGSTFPSNLRTAPPPILVFGKQSQSKAKTCYLLSHLLCKVFTWEWKRGPSTIPKGESSKAEACSCLSDLQRQISHSSQKQPDSLLREHWLLSGYSGNFALLRICEGLRWSRHFKKRPFLLPNKNIQVAQSVVTILGC